MRCFLSPGTSSLNSPAFSPPTRRLIPPGHPQLILRSGIFYLPPPDIPIPRHFHPLHRRHSNFFNRIFLARATETKQRIVQPPPAPNPCCQQNVWHRLYDVINRHPQNNCVEFSSFCWFWLWKSFLGYDQLWRHHYCVSIGRFDLVFRNLFFLCFLFTFYFWILPNCVDEVVICFVLTPPPKPKNTPNNPLMVLSLATPSSIFSTST